MVLDTVLVIKGLSLKDPARSYRHYQISLSVPIYKHSMEARNSHNQSSSSTWLGILRPMKFPSGKSMNIRD